MCTPSAWLGLLLGLSTSMTTRRWRGNLVQPTDTPHGTSDSHADESPRPPPNAAQFFLLCGGRVQYRGEARKDFSLFLRGLQNAHRLLCSNNSTSRMEEGDPSESCAFLLSAPLQDGPPLSLCKCTNITARTVDCGFLSPSYLNFVIAYLPSGQALRRRTSLQRHPGDIKCQKFRASSLGRLLCSS